MVAEEDLDLLGRVDLLIDLGPRALGVPGRTVLVRDQLEHVVEVVLLGVADAQVVGVFLAHAEVGPLVGVAAQPAGVQACVVQ